MKFYGVTNIPSSNEPGIHQYPETGFITITLNVQYKISKTNDYCIGIPYLIANNQSNQICLMRETTPKNTRALNKEKATPPILLPIVDKTLSVEFVDEELPSELDSDKAYVLNKEGFQSSFYISSKLQGRTIQYRLMARSSVITTDMLDAMLPVGEIKGLLYQVKNNRWLKPCDGTVEYVPADEYPLYTKLIESNNALRETFITVDNKTGYKTVKIPNLTNAFPVFVENAKQLAEFIPNSNTSPGEVFGKSTMAKVSFNHDQHNHGYDRSNDSNRKGYDTAGSPKSRNGGVHGTITTKVNSEVNLESPNIKHSDKVQVSENIIAPPHTPLIPHIVIR